MTLRLATPADAAAIGQLGRDSFVAAFGHLYRPDDLARFLDQAYALEAVAAEIADPAITHCLAVQEGGALAGFAKLKQPGGYGAHSDAQRPIALGQLYTDPALTGQGIGAELIAWAIGEGRRRGCDAMHLSVWAENHGAQRFYARHGFAKIADIDFWVGSHRDEEFLLELRL